MGNLKINHEWMEGFRDAIPDDMWQIKNEGLPILKAISVKDRPKEGTRVTSLAHYTQTMTVWEKEVIEHCQRSQVEFYSWLMARFHTAFRVLANRVEKSITGKDRRIVRHDIDGNTVPCSLPPIEYMIALAGYHEYKTVHDMLMYHDELMMKLLGAESLADLSVDVVGNRFGVVSYPRFHEIRAVANPQFWSKERPMGFERNCLITYADKQCPDSRMFIIDADRIGFTPEYYVFRVSEFERMPKQLGYYVNIDLICEIWYDPMAHLAVKIVEPVKE